MLENRPIDHINVKDDISSFSKAAHKPEHVYVDLHCHSSLSDGTIPPEQLVKKLSEFNVRYAALTDHDTLEGLEIFRRETMQYGINMITGVEITTKYKDYVLHILAYGFDPDHPEILNILSYSKNVTDPTSNILNGYYPPVDNAITAIHHSGGIAVLAHPSQTEPNFKRLNVLIDELCEKGLDGIEAIYRNDSEEKRQTLIKTAIDKKLVISAGTDFHTPEAYTPGIEMSNEMWKAFRDSLFRASGYMVAKEPLLKPHPRAKNTVRWPSFIFNIILPAFLSLTLFIIVLYAILLPNFEKVLLERKRDTIRELTQVAWGVLDEASQEEKNKLLTLEQAQALAKERIKAMRYGSENKDYFWLQDLSPKMLMHPYRSDLDGQDVSDFTDTRNVKIFVAFAELARQQGEGYISYVWHWKDDLERLEPKESYIRLFEPWGWVIGTGIYVHDVQDEIANLRIHLTRISLSIVIMVLLIMLYLINHGLRLEKSRSKAENLLLESMDRYRNLTDAATEGVLFVSNGRFKYANSVMLELLGCASHHLDLLGIDDIFPDVEANSAWRHILFKLENIKGIASGSGVLQRYDGSRLRCIFTIRHDPKGSDTGFMITVQREQDSSEYVGTRIALNRLLQLPNSVALDLTNAINQARQKEDIVALCKRSPELVHSLLENGASSVAISRMLSTISDAATQKLIMLTINEIGPPPTSFTFLSMGSQGRQSQTLYSDQDNAIIFSTDNNKDVQEIQGYFIKMATIVCDWLEKAGYRKCTGNKMASNPDWCQPLSVWKQYFKEWIFNPQEQQVVDFSIFFDFRPVEGDFEQARNLRNYIYSLLKESPHFFSQVAKNTLKFKAPLRLFGTIMTFGSKENSGRIDLKAPTMAIVAFARLYALQNHVYETNTLSRLDAITRLGVLLDSKRRDIVTAYESLLRLRLWTQSFALEHNKIPDNLVDPGQLGHIEDVILRECFNEIEELQNRIQRDFLGG